jgi:hypothetical protein
LLLGGGINDVAMGRQKNFFSKIFFSRVIICYLDKISK